MPLRLEPYSGDDRHPDWYEIWSGRSRVGNLRLTADGFRPPFWTFSITALHQLTTGIVTEGGGKTRDDCFASAQRCWADQLEALGLRDGG